MNLYEIFFIAISAVILTFSLMTILSRRILRSATYLLFVLLATAGLYAWMQFEFMAAVQVALYAGGIVVLIIFSILLTHHVHHKSQPFPLGRSIIGFGGAILGACMTIATLMSYPFSNQEAAEMKTDVTAIGQQLVATGDNGYVLPFEVISILLLSVLIGAIIVAKKDKTPINEPEK